MGTPALGTHEQLVRDARHLIRQGFARKVLERLPAPAVQLIPAIEQLRAHALTNTGAPRNARRVLRALVDQGHQDVETIGFLGRTEKDLARAATTKTQADRHWHAALSHYQQAFESSGDPYPGINAATLSLRLGAAAAAKQIAEQVVVACNTGLSNNPDQAYWDLPTLAEANLVLGNINTAKGHYAEAMRINGADLSAMGSMVRQARELLSITGQAVDLLDDVLAMPKVAVFAGHMMDTLNRSNTRFVPTNEAAVAARLAAAIVSNNVGVAYCCLANGSDIMFAEALITQDIPLNVVLPMEVEAFVAFSVNTNVADAARWEVRFRKLLQQAATVTVASDGLSKADAADLRYCNSVILGLANLKARELGMDVIGISVWDNQPGLPGGTADSIALWQQAGLPLYMLDPKGEVVANPKPAAMASTTDERQLMAMVFADMVGYSRFTEADIKIYYQQLLPLIAELAQALAPPAVQQTFGDAFYFVFDQASNAAQLALSLQALFSDLTRLPKLSQPLGIRIALHAGPLLPCVDPINQSLNYTGRHTSKAARVEPVAPENQILATQQFAALAATLPDQPYEFAYVGEQVLPKNYGAERLYLLTASDGELT